MGGVDDDAELERAVPGEVEAGEVEADEGGWLIPVDGEDELDTWQQRSEHRFLFHTFSWTT